MFTNGNRWCIQLALERFSLFTKPTASNTVLFPAPLHFLALLEGITLFLRRETSWLFYHRSLKIPQKKAFKSQTWL